MDRTGHSAVGAALVWFYKAVDGRDLWLVDGVAYWTDIEVVRVLVDGNDLEVVSFH